MHPRGSWHLRGSWSHSNYQLKHSFRGSYPKHELFSGSYEANDSQWSWCWALQQGSPPTSHFSQWRATLTYKNHSQSTSMVGVGHSSRGSPPPLSKFHTSKHQNKAHSHNAASPRGSVDIYRVSRVAIWTVLKAVTSSIMDVTTQLGTHPMIGALLSK